MKAAAVPIRAPDMAVKKPAHDPAWVVQRAWSMFRLPQLQELVELTIADLHQLPRPELPRLELVAPEELSPELLNPELIRAELLGPELVASAPTASPATANAAERDPVSDALSACCNELRDAAGITGARTDRIEHCQVVFDYMQQQPPTWSLAFTRALEEYRRAAAVALENTLARTTVV